MVRSEKGAHPIWALGTMSGTSLDGVDAAMLYTDGEAVFEFGPTSYRPYSQAEQSVLRAALGKWSGPEVLAASDIVQKAHVEILQEFEGAELIGFHGQTLAHAPRHQGTLQVGDGDALAEATNVPVVWDFRSADVALGGEGAPLAPFFHHALARHIGMREPVAFLNLGGVGNLTWVDPSKDDPAAHGTLYAFDTGPANAPINDVVMARKGQPYDKDGALAASGTADSAVVEQFLQRAYFAKIPPKSLDRDDFADLQSSVRDMSDADACATLAAICAACVSAGLAHCPVLPSRLLVSGGGRKNPVLMEMLNSGLACDVAPVEVYDLDGDMLEAQAFAFLAVRVSRGLPTSCPTTTGVRAAVGGGTVSTP